MQDGRRDYGAGERFEQAARPASAATRTKLKKFLLRYYPPGASRAVPVPPNVARGGGGETHLNIFLTTTWVPSHAFYEHPQVYSPDVTCRGRRFRVYNKAPGFRPAPHAVKVGDWWESSE
jgi:hypothetical protein